jgi:transposase
MHDPVFRAHVVSLTMAPGANVHELARQHHLTPSLLYRWRRRALPQATRPGPEVRLLPVQVAKSSVEKPHKLPGLIEIELADGIRLRVDAAVSTAALRRVLAVLRG